MARRRLRAFVAAVATAGALAGCGSGNPAGPSADPGVTLRGMVLDQGVASSATISKHSSGSQAATDAITVTVVENPAITATVGEDGSFTLRALPEGRFTLVFTSASGAILGTLSFDAVKPNQEITITVQVTGSGLLLLEERRNGIGHGDVEIEGLVDQVVTLSSTGDSTFVINGHTVIARPGQTAIREGNKARTVEDVTPGRRVHVKGVWLAPASSSTSAGQSVLAHEIKLQGPEAADDDAGGAKVTICHKKKNTITIGADAWPAHKAHGDTMGPCT